MSHISHRDVAAEGAPSSKLAGGEHPGTVAVIVPMEGGRIQVVHAGDVVIVPAHGKHWHGAAPYSSMSHIAIQDNPGKKHYQEVLNE